MKALELLSRVRGNNTDVEDQTTESLEEDIKGIMQALGFEQCFLLFAEAFPDEFDNEEEDDELLLTEELSSTTDTEAGSYNNP